MSAAGAAGAPPAAFAFSAIPTTCPRRARPSRRCSTASTPRPGCASPASSGRRATSPLLPLLPPHATIADVRRGPARSGEERYAAVMFVDMRGSTRRAEKRLPYDTVFLINQFLTAVSSAVVEAGGQPNQVLGDGLLAVFGLRSDPDEACRAAVAACGSDRGQGRRPQPRAGARTGRPDPFRRRDQRRNRDRRARSAMRGTPSSP